LNELELKVMDVTLTKLKWKVVNYAWVILDEVKLKIMKVNMPRLSCTVCVIWPRLCCIKAAQRSVAGFKSRLTKVKVAGFKSRLTKVKLVVRR
jgi:hypothetical protein